jgi:RNA 2',3'-cyclic 3'-phosphodiesterase
VGARLFVAAWPPEEVREALAGLHRPELPRTRWTTPEQWHVTLRFLGAVDQPRRAEDALGAVDAAPAEVVLGPAPETLGPKLLMLPVRGLDAVANAVRTATADVGDPPDARPFRGHLTLARSRARVSVADVPGLRLEARWTVDELALVRSELHPRGARYTTVATVTLPPVPAGGA